MLCAVKEKTQQGFLNESIKQKIKRVHSRYLDYAGLRVSNKRVSSSGYKEIESLS